MKRYLKTIFKLSILFMAVSFSLVLISDHVVSKEAVHCYAEINDVTPAKVGLVLGTSKYVKSGNINQYYQFRINATLELFKERKIEYILVSGDNSTTAYDEPNMFKNDLIKLGVPAERIVLDYAGFRTLDSVVRAKEVFQEENFIIISQPFHNERALYIAKHKGISASAFNAKDVGRNYGFKTQIREKFARVKTLLDLYLLDTKPKFLGEKIKIG